MKNYLIVLYAAVVALLCLTLAPLGVSAQEVGQSLPEDNIDFEWWQMVTGFFLPLLLSAIIQSKWSQKTQAFVAFGVSLVVTLVECYIFGKLENFTDPAQSVGIVLALTIAFYKGFWKPTGIAPKIEDVTNV